MDEPSRTAASPGHPELPTGNVTFLFTDIQGSTKLLQRLGADYATLLDRHNAIIERAIAVGGGAKVGSEGDSIFAAFPDTVRAIEAVAEAQRSLFREPWADGCVVRVRMGLHTGEGRLGAESYVGLDVHKAARISAAGHGGQVLLSAAAAEATRDHLPVGVTLVALGKHLLKDFDQPEDVYQLAASDLPSEFPPLRARRDNPLPTPMTALVGRDVDVESARELILRPGVRLVTITGPGGTGKTRLATELLHLVHPEFPDGVHYVDLSALSDPKLVLPALGRVLGILDAEGRDIAAAAAGLVARSRALVVLDNMEQVIDAAPDVVAVLEQTQDLKFLVTSREPLRVRGEFEYPLNPLSVPDRDTPTDELPHIPAVDLFVQRAQAVNPGFVLSDDNARTVAGIVARLDGLPLAIELAAPKLRGLSPQGLLERLEGRLDLLKGGARDLPDRHQTLWAAISWGYDLLDEDSKGLFRRLGVFAGGWTLEAVRVVGGAGDNEDRLIDQLSDLVTKSLVTFFLDAAGRPRYRLLETLRAFALEKLGEAGEETATRTAHLRWCLDLVERAEQRYTSADFPEVLDILEVERHNIRAALDWALANRDLIEEGLQVAGLLWIFWDVRGYATEGSAWLQRLLSTPGASARTRGRAIALDASGWLGRLTPASATPEDDFAEADEIWQELGDTRWLAWSVSMHAMITYNAFQPELARQQFEEGSRLARLVGDDRLADIWCTFGLAHVMWMSGDVAEAEQMLQRSLTAARGSRHVWAMGHGLFSLGILDLLKGDVEQAADRLQESLELRRDMRDARGIADCLGALALVAGASSDHRAAATLLGAAEAQREAAGQIPVPWLEPFIAQAASASAAKLGDVEFGEAMADGRRLSRAEAVDLALASRGPVPHERKPTGVSGS